MEYLIDDVYHASPPPPRRPSSRPQSPDLAITPVTQNVCPAVAV